MPIREEMERQGNWLFRWRGQLPLLFLPLIVLAMRESPWPSGDCTIHEVWEFLCLGVSLLGLAVRCLAVGFTPSATSGRNTRHQRAESLNTTGAYSVVRHPLYLGNYLIALGVTLVPLVWWLPVVYTLAFWLYYERIMCAEEAFLRDKFGDVFVHWAERTPTFIPNPLAWRPPDLRFSPRTVLKREYTGLFVVVLLHCGLEYSEHYWFEHRLYGGVFWAALGIAGIAGYLVLRTLKQRTTLLRVPGR
jgi:protein-S-isoprenylcysteine O-methyltransferase Ste14